MTTTVGGPTREIEAQRRNIAKARADGQIRRRQTISEYLDQLDKWRASLRISEALKLEVQDLHLEAEPPVLRVRFGKVGKSRLVRIHGELRAAATNHIRFRRISTGRLFEVKATSTAWRWYKRARAKAIENGGVPEGRWMVTHTLRHSAARHWLGNGVPINQVSVWLGHANLQTTLIYLQIIPDPRQLHGEGALNSVSFVHQQGGRPRIGRYLSRVNLFTPLGKSTVVVNGPLTYLCEAASE